MLRGRAECDSDVGKVTYGPDPQSHSRRTLDMRVKQSASLNETWDLLL